MVVETLGFLVVSGLGLVDPIVGLKTVVLGPTVSLTGLLVTAFWVVSVVNSVPRGPRTITVGAGGFVVVAFVE